MSSRIKATIFSGVVAVLTAIGLGTSSGQTQAAPLNFEIAGAPLSSASAMLGPSFCFRCSINTTLNPGLDAIAFTLNPGQSTTFDFFRISVGGFGGAFAEVSATLAFDFPSGVSVVGDGDGAFLTLGGIVSAGTLVWNDLPSVMTGSDGSQFSVDFSDIAGFTFGNSAQVTATVTALSIGAPAAPAAVPEPGTFALLGLGLLGVTAVRRRRAGM